MGPAQTVGQGFFPLDEELGLSSSSLTPRHHEHLVHLGAWMPFAHAARMLNLLLGVQVSEPTVRRLTEQAGALCEAAQSQLSAPSATAACAKEVISVDGAYVPLIKGEWAEVRTVAIGEAKEEITATGQREVHTSELSYFSRMTNATTFAELAEVEMQRRGVSQAKAVCMVSDGADWIQGFMDLHRPDALRILDFPHAAEHVSALIEAFQQEGLSLPANVLERSLHILKHHGPGLLLRWCDRLPDVIKQKEPVQKQLQYLRKREALMQYPLFRRQGWPIGSGMVESANKIVVEARLKGAGMHWEPTHVNPMLALRNGICNEQWQQTWRQSLAEQRRQKRSMQKHQATQRFQQVLSSCMLLLLQFLPPTPKPAPLPPRPLASAATLPGSSRPSPHHPWKRDPACRPKSVAKN
jgi:hypothetical protein